jgi:hypothetical protein
MMTKMMTKPLPFSDPGRFALYLFDSIRLPIIPERGPDSIQICVPLARAHYSIAHKSDRGAKLVKDLGGRDILVLPADELADVERHCRIPAGAFGPVIFDLERDAPLVDCDQAAVRDGDAVGVARQTGEHGLRARERALGVDEPALLAERGEERRERLGIGQMRM